MAKLSATKRQSLPSSSFALPGKGAGPKGKGSGAYPIDTAARARNALSRATQNATPSQQAQIKSKVRAKYPSITVGGKKSK